jgi:hypothetical protein
MIGRIFAIGSFAIFAGLAFSLRDLILPSPRQIPLPLGDLVLVSVLLALTALGWFVAQVTSAPLRLILAPASTAFAIGVALFAKQIRFPEAPLVGDGFEILIWIYAAVGFIGAVLGSLPALRTTPSERAAAVTVGIIVLSGVLGAVPYVLAS